MTLCFWSPLSNTFLFRAEPFIPTLFDVAAILGLHPYYVILSISIVYNPNGVANFEIHLGPMVDLAYTKFMRRFAAQAPASVTRNEHNAFLVYWLC